jgi:hypothetical protein
MLHMSALRSLLLLDAGDDMIRRSRVRLRNGDDL